jgi:dienelactone hydrolase
VLTRALALLAACVIVLGGRSTAQHMSAPLDKDLSKKMATLAEHWWKARPPTRFVDWDRSARAAIESEARAIGKIPDGALDEVVSLLWADAKKLGPKGALVKGKLTIPTPYGDAWCWWTSAAKHPNVVIGLHGGGEGAGSADEPRGTWVKKGAIGIYPQGIKLVHDTWNTVHGERFVLSLLEIAKAQYDADPDHVYVMGFSMGGSGSWYLAGRHPDLFAGAAPFSGVLMAAPKSQVMTKEEVTSIQHGLVPNVLNLPMYYTIGLADDHTEPGTYLYVADVLAKLREQYPGGYSKIHFETFPGMKHEFPPGEPAGAFKYLFAQERDTFPQELVWEYAVTMFPETDAGDFVTRLRKPIFYWLGCQRPEDKQRVHAKRVKNVITLDCTLTKRGASGITIYLNDAMIDPAQDVVVKSGDEVLYTGKPAPDVWTVLETLDDKLDRSMVFDRRIEL